MDLNSATTAGHVRNELFYFDDDPMAIFLVENQLFKVHRHCLIKGSEVFRDMFAQAGGKGKDATECTSEGQPIPLPDVTVKEFEVLLRFIYATTMQPTFNDKFLVQILAYDQEEKLALLSVAHRFVFDKIFQYIVNEIKIDDVGVVDRIRLGDKYDLEEWLFSSYKEIIDRTLEGMPTEEEAQLLGSQRVIKLLQAKNFMLRELLRKNEAHRRKGHTTELGWLFDNGIDHEMASTAQVVRKYFSGSK